MAHGLIVGQTESGKTIAAKTLACKFISKGFAVLVHDPVCDPEWKQIVRQHDNGKPGEFGYVTPDPYDYNNAIKNSRSCFLMVDESGDHCGHYDKEFFWWATKSRHWGHSAYFIAQRAQMVAPTIRAQCRYLLMFNSSVADSKILSDEWNQPVLKDCNLKQFEYYYVSRFQQPVKSVVKPVDDWHSYCNNKGVLL